MTRPPVLMLDAVEQLIQARRTSLRVDPDRPIDTSLVDRLIQTIAWAPNHRRTWPWRVALITGAGRERLGKLVATFEARNGARPERIEKARTKYLRAPVILLVGQTASDSSTQRAEDRDTIAAGVQNLLLAATAAGLASHWATGSWLDDAGVKGLAGLVPEDQLIALVYLGWPLADVPTPPRPSVPVHVVNA